MNEVEEFLKWVVEERRKAEEEERRQVEQNWSLEAVVKELSDMQHASLVLKSDFEKIGNLPLSEYHRGRAEAAYEAMQHVLKLRSIAEVLEQAKRRLEEVKDKAVLRKELDIEIDLTWSIAEIDEAIRRLRG